MSTFRALYISTIIKCQQVVLASPLAQKADTQFPAGFARTAQQEAQKRYVQVLQTDNGGIRKRYIYEMGKR